jgi:hypothetical protein
VAAKRGGSRPGAGRKVGSKARATLPQKITFSDLAREHAPAALHTLVAIMKDDGSSESARVAAANVILDRAYGKPPQAMTHSGPDGSPIQTEDVTTPERRRAALALLLAQQ